MIVKPMDFQTMDGGINVILVWMQDIIAVFGGHQGLEEKNRVISWGRRLERDLVLIIKSQKDNYRPLYSEFLRVYDDLSLVMSDKPGDVSLPDVCYRVRELMQTIVRMKDPAAIPSTQGASTTYNFNSFFVDADFDVDDEDDDDEIIVVDVGGTQPRFTNIFYPENME